MGLTIWLPSGADHGDRALVGGTDTSRPIVDRCRICREFVVFEGEHPRTMEMHLRRCVAANEALLREERERQHPSIMAPWDPEFFRWMRSNERAVLEGRLKP